MTFITTLRDVDVARGSMAKGGVELGNAVGALALTRSLSSGAIAIGTTTTKVKSAATITGLVNGTFTSKGATDDLWTLSGTTVAVSSWQKYLLLLDSSGTASIQEATQSTISAAAVSYSNVSGMSPYAPLLTMLNSGKLIAGYLTVATDSSHTFVPGTTDLNGTGITTTYTNGIDPYLLPILASQNGTVVGNGA